ncbi:nitrile hydratase accessory protein [uncultured Roseobacter sp.]|uniref:nitrile hydratase accessory protein n=1 Tax=uncultured Roseobacter sp. TaxID=114847 RepID=UPI00261E63D5|nr:nitrile hydratase accessory protein [uncultured Roseobacter sp.]
MINPTEIVRSAQAPGQDDEPVFMTPWEARIFAMTAHLAEQKGFAWGEFRDLLIQHIAEDEGTDDTCNNEVGTPYYRSWLAATETLLSQIDACSEDELNSRIDHLSNAHGPGKDSPTGDVAMPVSEG